MSPQAVFGQIGIGLLEVEDGEIGTIDTEIEATIENWGYDRIFVALPEDWHIDVQRSGATRSYRVRETGLWRIYGRKANKSSLYGRGDVFTLSGTPIKPFTIISLADGPREGWWLRPNEGINIDIYLTEIPKTGVVIDPVKIEKENPQIRVIRWFERFTLKLHRAGYITAPWIVEGAGLVESYPAVYARYGNLGSKVYFDKYRKDVPDVPAWDEWFNLKNSLVYQMTDTRVAPLDLEFQSVNESEVILNNLPVWRVDNVYDIIYAYEWKSYKKVEGATVWQDTGLDIPAWFELF